MKQVCQRLRTGKIEVREVPVPSTYDSFVLVRTVSSVISAGTEKTKIDMGKKSLLQKAKSRPDLVRQVLQKIKTDGLKKTLQTINTRLDAPSALGYSLAGTVVAVGDLVEGIMPGDRVACAGAGFANHAEFVAVPKNLVARVPEKVTLEEAAFTTVGAVALQGIRLATPIMGETFLVIGLGLLGQLTTQLLKANGCQVIGMDLDPTLVERIENYDALGVEGDVEQVCATNSSGAGVDGVIICAGTDSNEPIELAGRVTREKGRVVVVGAVGMNIPRTEYFKKEINLVISRSYGPGRYDPTYEEGGVDYPLGYVRFTEKRNLETFLSLVAEGKVCVSKLITHRFELYDAAKAYKLVEGEKTEPYLGIVLNYREELQATSISDQAPLPSIPLTDANIRVSFFGAGNYATATLLPLLREHDNVSLDSVATVSGRTASGVQEQFGFDACTHSLQELLFTQSDAICIATRHNVHAASVKSVLAAGKHVYVEKPLALTLDELALVHQAYSNDTARKIMVGFNRRFAPATLAIKKHFESHKGPFAINIRVNAGAIPADHWIQNANEGGGRIVGEACHFIDLASALVGGNPKTVYAAGMRKGNISPRLNDNVSITLMYENGSIATILYIADGTNSLAKEYIEVFGGGKSAIVDDFKRLSLYAPDARLKVKRYATQNKGQAAMIGSWINALENGHECIPYEEILYTSLASILAIESLTIGETISINPHALKLPRV